MEAVNHMTGNEIVIYDAQIGRGSYRNFEGRSGEYNSQGSRNFVVFLDEEFAREIEAKGAPVVWKPDKYNEGSLRAQMKVHVKYSDRYGNPLTPPKIILMSKKNRTPLDEEDIKMLDRADISRWDLILTMYKNKGNMGPDNSVSLDTLYAKLNENELDAMYSEESEEDSAAVPW